MKLDVTEDELNRLERYTADLFYAFESVKLDDAGIESGLWQGRWAHHKMHTVNEVRAMLGFEALYLILDGEPISPEGTN
jgi:hypothetical protein